jgi:hypothetical protein
VAGFKMADLYTGLKCFGIMYEHIIKSLNIDTQNQI